MIDNGTKQVELLSDKPNSDTTKVRRIGNVLDSGIRQNMNTGKHLQETDNGQIVARRYYEGLTYTQDDVQMHQRLFTNATSKGWIVGWDMNLTFTIDRPAKEVWSLLKDFNLWQNSYGYYYSGIVGDLYSSVELKLGEETFHLNIRIPGKPEQEYPYKYQVLKVIPERLIVVFQPIPKDGSNGGISPGFHVIILHENDGKTVVTVQMEHASRTPDVSEDEAIDPWRNAHMPEVQKFWRDIFIPNLKKLAYEARKI